MSDYEEAEYTPSALPTLTGIYLGPRNEQFKSLIIRVLNKGNLKERLVQTLTSPENLQLYSDAFTSELVDKNHNYQVYEQLGDVTANKFIVWYFYKRFPQLKCAEGVRVVARLRINYGSKQSFYPIAEKLGFWDFISATNDLRQRKKKSLLEDVLEAFLGVTELILDEQIRFGIGYACVFAILNGIFDEMDISLKYEDLYDSKTLLKELFDLYGDERKVEEKSVPDRPSIGQLKYEETRQDLVTHSAVYRIVKNDRDGRPLRQPVKVLIGRGSAALKIDAQKNAAKDALKNLAREGYVKVTPNIYKRFSGEKIDLPTTEKDVLRLCQGRINDQFATRGKSKHQTKYTSTALIHYCRERDYRGIKECLKLGAKPNIADSEGLSATDVLLIGPMHAKLVCRVMKKFFEVEKKLDVHANVVEVYLTKYFNGEYADFFATVMKEINLK